MCRILLLAAFLLPSLPLRAEEPEVSLAVKSGWLHFAVATRNGEPVKDAPVFVYDAKGQKIAEGDSGDDGKGEFPLPGGGRAIVEFKIGKRMADPILLKYDAKAIFPERVLLSFGLRPCCRSVAGKGEAKASDPAVVVTPKTRVEDLAKAAEADLEKRGFRLLSDPLKQLLSDAKYRTLPTQTYTFLGEAAPDLELKDTDGRPWKLSKEVKKGPVILVFYYGYHCEHCVSQLFGLHKDAAKFKELGATIVAVSADPATVTRERFTKYGAFAFPVLSDPDNAVASEYGACYLHKNSEPDLLHGTFVIDRSGKIVWANRGDGPFTDNRTLLTIVHRAEQAFVRSKN